MKRIATIAILSITACPQDDAASMPSETGAGQTTTAGPDLPGDSSTTQPGDGDGDGDGDPTTGEGDGDTTGDGDPGDGDGDTGSEAVPASLVVESDGQRIGYLMGVWDYGLYIWDDETGAWFSLNANTGHVAGGGTPSYMHTTNDCTGQRYMTATYVAVDECNDVGPHFRQYIFVEGGTPSGHLEASSLVTHTGPSMLVSVGSVSNSQGCIQSVGQVCAYAVEATNVIPKTFALPIEIVESP